MSTSYTQMRQIKKYKKMISKRIVIDFNVSKTNMILIDELGKM